jgi:hypothetical protein
MAKKEAGSKRTSRTIVCSFCLNSFPPDQIWWVDMIMHRNDPNCTSKYATASCGKCKDDPDNFWMIVGIHEEPKLPKEKKQKVKNK